MNCFYFLKKEKALLKRVFDIFLIGQMVIFSSCIEEIKQFSGNETPIIIDGVITDQKGPHTIKVLKQLRFNQPPNYDQFRGASVQIINDLEQVEQLTYAKYGKFESSADFRGEIGRSYFVRVILPDGTKYESTREMMLSVPKIDSLWYELNDTNIDFKINFLDESNERNYLRWRFRGTYEVFSPLAASVDPESQTYCHPKEYLQELQSTCWLTDFDEEFLLIEEDLYYQNRPRENALIYSLYVDRKFNYGYSALIEQQSLTNSAYNYWNAIRNQQGNTGSIFETANYRINGNISNVNDPGEFVLGFFGASSVSAKRIYVEVFENRFGEIDCSINPAACYPLRCLNCLSYGSTATIEKPNFWPN